MIEPEYARFSEESNALDYLEKTVEFIHRAETNSTDWKWVILSLHGALYGFMICALKGTDPARVVVYNKKRERRLISFGKALEWCQDPRYMNMTTESQVLRLSQGKNARLISFRSTSVMHLHIISRVCGRSSSTACRKSSWMA